MAQTSSAFSGIPSAQYTRLYLDFWVASQSTANNQTTFGYKLVIGGVDGGSGSTQGGAYTFSNAWSASASGLTWSWSTSSHKTIREGTFVVTHNADGTLSNRTLTAAASFITSGGTATASTSVTISVPTIPRYAEITAFTASINDTTANVSWTADKTISEYRWSYNGGTWYVIPFTAVNAKSGSFSMSVTPGNTYGFLIQVRNSESGLITTSSVLNKTATKTPSTLTLNTTSQNIGSGITWTINESYDYTHTIRFFFGNTNGYILGSASAPSNTATGTWTLPAYLADQIPNATSGSGTITVYTYYGGVYIGSKSYTFTAKVPNNTTWQPAVPTVTISHVGSRPSGFTSYVQGKSRAKVVSSSTAQGGASIKSYRVVVSSVGTYYGSSITSGYMNGAGTVTITVRATDSRGYYREKSNTVTVVSYSPPKLTAYTAKRSPNDQGTDLATSINFSISSIDNYNSKQYRIRYRPTGGTWVSLVDSTAYYTRSTTHSATGVLDANSSYEVEFHVSDYYTSVTQTRNIGTAFQLLDFNASGRGIAFGKVSEANSFEVAMTSNFKGPVTFEDFLYKKINYVIDQATNLDNLTAIASDSNAWNHPDLHQLFLENANNALHIMVDGISNHRAALLQVGHAYASYAEYPGTLKLNPMGGEVTVNNQPVVTHNSGSSSSGRYVKFSDGTLVCYATVQVDLTSTTFQDFPFPAAPINADNMGLSIGFANTASDGLRMATNSVVLTESFGNRWRIWVRQPDATTSSFPAYMYMIGRWK